MVTTLRPKREGTRRASAPRPKRSMSLARDRHYRIRTSGPGAAAPLDGAGGGHGGTCNQGRRDLAGGWRRGRTDRRARRRAARLPVRGRGDHHEGGREAGSRPRGDDGCRTPKERDPAGPGGPRPQRRRRRDAGRADVGPRRRHRARPEPRPARADPRDDPRDRGAGRRGDRRARRGVRARGPGRPGARAGHGAGRDPDPTAGGGSRRRSVEGGHGAQALGRGPRGVPQDLLRRGARTPDPLRPRREHRGPPSGRGGGPHRSGRRRLTDRRYGTTEKRSIDTSSPVAAGRAVASTTIRRVWTPSASLLIERATSNVGDGAKLSTVRTRRPST